MKEGKLKISDRGNCRHCELNITDDITGETCTWLHFGDLVNGHSKRVILTEESLIYLKNFLIEELGGDL